MSEQTATCLNCSGTGSVDKDGNSVRAYQCPECDDPVRAAAPKLMAALRWIADHGDTGEGGRPAYYAMRAHAREAIKGVTP